MHLLMSLTFRTSHEMDQLQENYFLEVTLLWSHHCLPTNLHPHKCVYKHLFNIY